MPRVRPWRRVPAAMRAVRRFSATSTTDMAPGTRSLASRSAGTMRGASSPPNRRCRSSFRGSELGGDPQRPEHGSAAEHARPEPNTTTRPVRLAASVRRRSGSGGPEHHTQRPPVYCGGRHRGELQRPQRHRWSPALGAARDVPGGDERLHARLLGVTAGTALQRHGTAQARRVARSSQRQPERHRLGPRPGVSQRTIGGEVSRWSPSRRPPIPASARACSRPADS